MSSHSTHPQPPILDAAILLHLAQLPGECLSVHLTPRHPGAPEGQRLALLQSLFQSLKSAADSELQQRIEAALEAHEWSGGGSGLAIFAGRDFLEVYRAPVESPRIHSGEACFLLPFLFDAYTPQDFLVLGISRKLLRLVHYWHGEGVELPLPPGMPAYPDAMVAHVDHTSAYLRNFFGEVDEWLAPTLGHRLLLLMGLEEEIVDFRSVAKHCHLFAEAIPHGMRDLPLREITQLARECAQSRRRAEGREALRKFRERGNRRLALQDPGEILEAARAGRVQSLCVPEATEGGEEALWNLAVVETLRHGGDVFSTAADSLAAILRY